MSGCRCCVVGVGRRLMHPPSRQGADDVGLPAFSLRVICWNGCRDPTVVIIIILYTSCLKPFAEFHCLANSSPFITTNANRIRFHMFQGIECSLSNSRPNAGTSETFKQVSIAMEFPHKLINKQFRYVYDTICCLGVIREATNARLG
jgi:hypothetical protein